MPNLTLHTLLIILVLGCGIGAIISLFMGVDTWIAVLLAASGFSLAMLPMFVDNHE